MIVPSTLVHSKVFDLDNALILRKVDFSLKINIPHEVVVEDFDASQTGIYLKLGVMGLESTEAVKRPP